MVNLQEVEAFFFKAMVEGWAAGGKKISVPDMPGFKAIVFRDGDFVLRDQWGTTPHSQASVGITTIWVKGDLVWVMNYGGLYDERAIGIVKAALRKAYGAHQFIGGRGSSFFIQGLFAYVNEPRSNDFSKFDGREEVFEFGTGKSLGRHEYWGMSLL